MLLTIREPCDILMLRYATTEREVILLINVSKIKGRLAELNLTQKDVAKALGIAPPTVSQKLNRVRPMDLEEAEKLANLLEIKDEEFRDYFFAS